ncbi:MAG: hypothetical protein ABIF87_18370 [Pseudomonadota bacterium]
MTKKIGNTKAIAISAFLTLQFLLTSCATTSSNISFTQETTQRDKSSALIYVYRLPDIFGAAVSWRVTLDNKVVALLKQGAYFPLQVSPGLHNITIGDTSPTELAIISVGNMRAMRTFFFEANQTYYLKSKGTAVLFMEEEAAMEDLRDMKYDKGI